jgi:hypothetical protein
LHEVIRANEKELRQQTGEHGRGEGREEIPLAGLAQERPEEEIEGGLLAFFLVVERENGERE